MTIVVLLILAGVSISLILDNNGIIQKSKDARREYGQAKANEQKDLDNASDWIDETVTGYKVVKSFKEAKTENSTIDGKKEGNANNPTIPAGYVPINTETSNWGNGKEAPSQDSVDNGLVIRDNSNNEWVWVPVPDVTVMCDTTNETEYTLCGTTGETEVKTKLYSKSEIVSGKTRATPGTATSYYEYREPDLLVEGSSVYSYSSIAFDAGGCKTILGETGTTEQLAQLFVDNYREMIESVSKYGGFYIGRYELSEAGVQKNQPTLAIKNWYYLYNECRSSKLQASDKVKTEMIWGCQWDVTWNFVVNNYTKVGYKEIADELQNTGANETRKANNIYWEWTQEASGTNEREFRGCNNFDDGTYELDYRGGSFPNYSVYGPATGLRYPSYFNNKD